MSAGPVACADCGAPTFDADPFGYCPRCADPTREGEGWPDPYEVAGGLDLRALETTRAYRQSKARRRTR